MAIVCTLTVSYNANGGSGAPSGANYTSGGDAYPVTVNAALATSTPSRSYYKFLGWAKSSTATGASYQPGSTYSHTFTSGTTASVVFYAVWQHKTAVMSYSANGGSGAPSSQTVNQNEWFALRTGVPTRTGYNFLGWASSSTATTAQYQPGDSARIVSNMTLYAVWEIKTYTVSYNKGANGTGTNTSATKTHDVALTLLGATFTRTGYTQTGWSTTDGGSKTYNLSASYTTNAATTLFPYWTANTYTVSYDKGANGTGTNTTATKTHDINLQLAGALFTRTSYAQTAWSTTDGGDEAYALGDTYTANAAITLYPYWTYVTPTYTVSYNANGGTGAPSNQTKIQDENLTLSSTTPTLGSCAFLGWATSKANAMNKIVAYSAGDPYTVNAAITLYAVWDTDSIVFRKTSSGMKFAFVSVKKNGNMTHSSVFIKSSDGTMVKI